MAWQESSDFFGREFEAGDVLVAVSLDDLRFFAARLTPPGAGN